jgi:PPM family protein phosphatase
MLRFAGAGLTDVGRVRDNNEDSAFVGPYVAVVADGVGGAAAGEVASATAAYLASAEVLARTDGSLSDLLAGLAQRIHVRLAEEIEADPAREGMATTLTMVATDGERVLLGHLGDSRAYLLRDGELSRLSHDHTYVQMLVDTGRLDAEGAKQHPYRNVVLRSLQGVEADELDLIDLSGRPGDRLLLCSDGLSDLVEEAEIAAILREESDREDAVTALVARALEAGGIDNVTCVVLDVIDGPLVVGDGRVLGALADLTRLGGVFSR